MNWSQSKANKKEDMASNYRNITGHYSYLLSSYDKIENKKDNPWHKFIVWECTSYKFQSPSNYIQNNNRSYLLLKSIPQQELKILDSVYLLPWKQPSGVLHIPLFSEAYQLYAIWTISHKKTHSLFWRWCTKKHDS